MAATVPEGTRSGEEVEEKAVAVAVTCARSSVMDLVNVGRRPGSYEETATMVGGARAQPGSRSVEGEPLPSSLSSWPPTPRCARFLRPTSGSAFTAGRRQGQAAADPGPQSPRWRSWAQPWIWSWKMHHG
ncbi:hypothetical protein E2562_032156 [Oryza meyeriana var. granulata]|uniref:Uncharacterized protein n=1 Tax=Oryza meyeriana var. granulata TaxID=110450 RepID=A0A6G1E520_9ORYZ|nr:hypothetical protein E2562_032156 [Oryza meyeriana var. granulata]